MAKRQNTRKVITCTIPQGTWEQIEEARKISSIKYGYLICRGWDAIQGAGEATNAAQIEKLQAANARLQAYIHDINMKLDSVGKRK